jgi:hypothetical protein
MKSIRKKYLKSYGYEPTDNELLTLYQGGDLILTDKEENDLIEYFEL